MNKIDKFKPLPNGRISKEVVDELIKSMAVFAKQINEAVDKINKSNKKTSK